VIQEHSTPDGGHWDMMLQIEDTLWTWRLHHPPQHIQDTPIPAEKIADHPLRFLSYEGPVQNNTGSVKIIDKGHLLCLDVHENKCYFTCHGNIISGTYLLHRQEQNKWLLKVCKKHKLRRKTGTNDGSTSDCTTHSPKTLD
jgi:hypothetical protein